VARLLTVAMLAFSLTLAACGQAAPSPPVAATGSVVTSLAPATAVAPSAPSVSTSAPASAAPGPASGAAAGIARIVVARSAIRLPSARSRAVALALGSTIFVTGGLTTTGATSGGIIKVDPGSGIVSRAGTLAFPVHDAGGAVEHGAAFIFGGGRVAPGAIVERVSALGVGRAVGALPAARADLAAVSIDGEMMIVGGGTPARADVRVLGTTDGVHFRTVAKLIVGVRYPAVAVVDGTVYVVGGSTPAGDSRVIQSVDPRTGIVRIVGHLAVGLSHAAALVVGSAFLIAGGRTAGRAMDALWRFDPATARLTRIGRLPYAVSDAAVAVVDGVGYLIGGEDRRPLASIIVIEAD